MIAVLIVVATLGILSFAMLSMVGSTSKTAVQLKNDMSARFVAEAGLTEAVYDMSLGGTGQLGAANQRVDFAGGEFWVTIDSTLGPGITKLTSTGLQGRSASRVEMVIEQASSGFFQWGAFGDDGLTMDSNARVDSYDSTLGIYEDQDNNGNGSNRWANDEGHIGSNGDIELDSNAKVWGDAAPGPTGTVILNGNAVVSGSTTPSAADEVLPPITVPPIVSSGNYSLGGSSSDAFASGDIRFGSFTMDSNSTLTITGPARVVVDDFVMGSNSEIVVDASNGPVEWYVGGDFILNSNAQIAATDLAPENLSLNLSSTPGDTIDFDSNGKLYGMIYGPDAHIEINSNFEVYGSLVGRRVHLDSNSRVHFDEALRTGGSAGSQSGYTKVAYWHTQVRRGEIDW